MSDVDRLLRRIDDAHHFAGPAAEVAGAVRVETARAGAATADAPITGAVGVLAARGAVTGRPAAEARLTGWNPASVVRRVQRPPVADIAVGAVAVTPTVISTVATAGATAAVVVAVAKLGAVVAAKPRTQAAVTFTTTAARLAGCFEVDGVADGTVLHVDR